MAKYQPPRVEDGVRLRAAVSLFQCSQQADSTDAILRQVALLRTALVQFSDGCEVEKLRITIEVEVRRLWKQMSDLRPDSTIPAMPSSDSLKTLSGSHAALTSVVEWCEKYNPAEQSNGKTSNFAPEPATLPHWNPQTEARDKWIYEQRCSGRPDKKTEAELRQHPEWDHVGQERIRQIAVEYAQRHGLPNPPERRAGRKPGRKEGR